MVEEVQVSPAASVAPKTDEQLIAECKGYYNAMLEAMQTLAGRSITVQFSVDNGAQNGSVKNNGFVATKKVFEDVPPPPPTQGGVGVQGQRVQ